jgi:hypothetical protein
VWPNPNLAFVLGCLIVLPICLGQPLFAQQFDRMTPDPVEQANDTNPTAEPPPQRLPADEPLSAIEFTLQFGALFLDSDEADRLGLKEAVYELGLQVAFDLEPRALNLPPVIGRHLKLGLGAGVLVADERDPQRIVITIDDETVDEGDSLAIGAALHGFIGFEYPLLKVLAANAQFGGKAIYLTRAFVQTRDADLDEIDLDGALFLGGGLALGRRFKVRIQYHKHFLGNLDQQVFLGVSVTF